MERPERPYTRSDWGDLPAAERSRLNREYVENLRAYWMHRAGVREADDTEQPSWYFCPECFANGASKDCEPELGLFPGDPEFIDSYGDCGADGESLTWVTFVEQPSTCS